MASMKKRHRRSNSLTYFALFACGWLICLLLILYISTSQNHNQDSITGSFVEVEEKFKYLYHRQPVSNVTNSKTYLRFRATSPKHKDQHDNIGSHSKSPKKSRKKTSSTITHSAAKDNDVSKDRIKHSIAIEINDDRSDSQNEDGAFSLFHLILNSSSHSTTSLYSDNDDDDNGEGFSNHSNSNTENKLDSLMSIPYDGTNPLKQRSVSNNDTTITSSTIKISDPLGIPKLVIYVIWPHPYNQFTSINYLALDSILFVYPHASIRFMHTTYRHNTRSKRYNMNDKHYGILPHQLDKYSKLGYDIQYDHDDDDDNQMKSMKNPLTQYTYAKKRRKRRIEMEVDELNSAYCHQFDSSSLLNSVGHRVACLYTNKWLFQFKSIQNLDTTSTISDTTSGSSSSSSSSNHSDFMKMTHLISISPQYPYHLIFFLALTKLWQSGGIFTDLSYFFQHPITSTSTVFTHRNSSCTDSAISSSHHGNTNTSNKHQWNLRNEGGGGGGYHINFHCQKKSLKREVINDSDNSFTNRNDKNDNKNTTLHGQSIRSGSSSSMTTTSTTYDEYYNHKNKRKNKRKDKKCVISTLLLFPQPRNPIVMCMLLSYQISAQFIYCIEHDMFYGGANCILNALVKCFDKHNQKNIFITTDQDKENDGIKVNNKVSNPPKGLGIGRSIIGIDGKTNTTTAVITIMAAVPTLPHSINHTASRSSSATVGNSGNRILSSASIKDRSHADSVGKEYEQLVRIEVYDNDPDMAANRSLPLLQQLVVLNDGDRHIYDTNNDNNNASDYNEERNGSAYLDTTKIDVESLNKGRKGAVSVVWLGSLATSGQWFPNIQSLQLPHTNSITTTITTNIQTSASSESKKMNDPNMIKSVEEDSSTSIMADTIASLSNGAAVIASKNHHCENMFVCKSYSTNMEILKYAGLKHTSYNTGMESAGCGPMVVLTGFKYSGMYALAKDLLNHPQILMPLHLPRHIQSYLLSSSSYSLSFSLTSSKADSTKRHSSTSPGILSNTSYHYSQKRITATSSNKYKYKYNSFLGTTSKIDISAAPYESSPSLRRLLDRTWSFPYIPANQPQPFISIDISPNYATDYLTPFLLKQDQHHHHYDVNTTDNESAIMINKMHSNININREDDLTQPSLMTDIKKTTTNSDNNIKLISNTKVIFVISRPVDRMYTEYINSYLQIRKALKMTAFKTIAFIISLDMVDMSSSNNYHDTITENQYDDDNDDTSDGISNAANLDIEVSNILKKIDKILLLSSSSLSVIDSQLIQFKQSLIELQIKYQMLLLGFDELVEYGMSIDNKFSMLRTLLRSLRSLKDDHDIHDSNDNKNNNINKSDENKSMLDLVIKYYYQQNFKNEIIESMFMHSIQFPSILHYQQTLGKENVYIAIADDTLIENMNNIHDDDDNDNDTDINKNSTTIKKTIHNQHHHDMKLNHKAFNTHSSILPMSTFLNQSHVFGHVNFLSDISSFLGVCPLSSWIPANSINRHVKSEEKNDKNRNLINNDDNQPSSSSSFQVRTMNDSMLPLKLRMSYEMLQRLDRFFLPFIHQLSWVINMNLNSHWTSSQQQQQQQQRSNQVTATVISSSSITYEDFNTYSHHFKFTAKNTKNITNIRTWYDIEDEEVKISDYHQHNSKTDDDDDDDDDDLEHSKDKPSNLSHNHKLNHHGGLIYNDNDVNSKKGLLSKLLPKARDKKEDNGYNTTIGMLNVFG